MAETYDFLRTFTFDGKETNHLFQIAKVNIPFMTKENDFYTVGNTDGKHFRNTKLGEHSISIDGFVIKDNTGKSVSNSLDELKLILNSDEPKQLIFDLFPERYFNAIYSGVQEYDATNLDYTPLTLVFDVPDALSHSINPIGYSNVSTTGINLMLDSEYLKTKKYMKQWVQMLDEKYDGSNIVMGDFTNGIPINFERTDDTDERWLNWNPMTMRHLPQLKQGDSVNFSIFAKVMSIDTDNPRTFAGEIVLEEWDSKESKILKRHVIQIPKEVNADFVKHESVAYIQHEKTNALNINYGFRGANLIKWSKPMLALANTSMNYVPSEEGISDVVKVVNNGTYRTKPVFNFRMNGENGLVALVNQNGSVLQFGNPEDVDGTESSRVEKGLDEGFWGNTLNPDVKVNTGFNTVYPNFVDDPSRPNLIQGSWNMTNNVDEIQPIFTGVGDIGVWHGPTVMMDILPPSNGDRTLPISHHYRFGFNNYDKAQRGRIEFSTFDETGEPLMTAIVRDSDISNNEIVFEAWWKRKKLVNTKLDRKTFSKAFYEINMDRRGNQLIWRLVQIKNLTNNGQWSSATIDKEYKFTWNLEEPDTSKFMKSGVWIMRYSNKFHVIMSLTDVQARWEGTPYYQDIKNYFQDGDLVEIDTNSRELYVNGVVNNDLNVVGNQWEDFILPVGETFIQPIVSSWANMAEVTAEVRDSFL